MTQSSGATASFDRVAEIFERSRLLPETVADALAKRVVARLRPADWFLDAGMGTGRTGRALATRYVKTVGVDLSPSMLAQASTVPHRALADITALPFPDNTFAGILSLHVLPFVSRWPDALQEMWRTLRPGGELFLAYEDREREKVRDKYIDSARAAGVWTTPVGATNAQMAAALQKLAGNLVEERPPYLRYESTLKVSELLDQLQQRAFSPLWSIPDATHESLMNETREFAAQTMPDPDASETVRVGIVLLRARKT